MIKIAKATTEEQLQKVMKALGELQGWKERQEQAQADRLVEMRNVIVEALVARSATVSEILTVMEMVKLEAASTFVSQQRNQAAAAVRTATISRQPVGIEGQAQPPENDESSEPK